MGTGVRAGKLQEHAQYRLRIFAGNGGVQVKHEQADKGPGCDLEFFAKVASRGWVLDHWQGQREGELTGLRKEGLLHKACGAPDVVDQLEGRYVLGGEVGQFPEKVTYFALGLTEELRVNVCQFLALHGGHEEDAGVVVLCGELLPTDANLALHIGGNVGHGERNLKVVEHGRKRPQVFTQAHGRGGVADEVETLGRC